jgi:hypothetical protein
MKFQEILLNIIILHLVLLKTWKIFAKGMQEMLKI